MHLNVEGHPIHSRALAVTLLQRADGKLDAQGYILDVRKRGFVPMAGDLQGTGIIHHMRLDAIVDPETATLETIRAEQPTVAVEPSATSAGESCRDPIAAVEAMAGTSLDGGFSRRVSTAMGGPRGCSHLMTLAHLLGSTAAWALARDRAVHGPTPARPAGQRVFRRDVIVDGHETAAGDGTLVLALQLADLHFAPTPEIVQPMARFAGDHELRGLFRVEFPSFVLKHMAVAQRTRMAGALEQAPWRDRNETVGDLVGKGFGFGINSDLLQRLGAHADDRPLLDALLMVGPTLIQCTATLAHAWPEAYRAAAKAGSSMGGFADSCYIWRQDGALARTRVATGE
jgi:hypothetical protein